MSFSTIKTKCLAISKEIDSLKDSYSASTISFDSATHKILDSASGLGFLSQDDKITISGSGSNNGVFTVSTGGESGYCVVVENLTTEIAGSAVSISAPTQVYFGEYPFDKGVGDFLSFYPGPVGEQIKIPTSSIRSWTLYADLFVKYTTEAETWEKLTDLRSELIDIFEKYPILNNSSGILKVRSDCPIDPEAIFDKSNNGPFWITQRINLVITEKVTVSGGDFS